MNLERDKKEIAMDNTIYYYLLNINFKFYWAKKTYIFSYLLTFFNLNSVRDKS